MHGMPPLCRRNFSCGRSDDGRTNRMSLKPSQPYSLDNLDQVLMILALARVEFLDRLRRAGDDCDPRASRGHHFLMHARFPKHSDKFPHLIETDVCTEVFAMAAVGLVSRVTLVHTALRSRYGKGEAGRGEKYRRDSRRQAGEENHPRWRTPDG